MCVNQLRSKCTPMFQEKAHDLLAKHPPPVELCNLPAWLLVDCQPALSFFAVCVVLVQGDDDDLMAEMNEAVGKVGDARCYSSRIWRVNRAELQDPHPDLLRYGSADTKL